MIGKRDPPSTAMTAFSSLTSNLGMLKELWNRFEGRSLEILFEEKSRLNRKEIQ